MNYIKNGTYRKDIDGLRAFAIIAVIINHFDKGLLPSGYLGVDIFFVISGYVITSSLYKRPNKNFLDFLSNFYARRIRRLVPALSIFVIICSFLICLFNNDAYESLNTGITSLFGLSNIYLFSNSTDYFAQSTQLNVFTHTWSLGVEEQFYFIFPFLIWFTGFGRQTQNGERNLFLVLAILSIVSLIAYLYLYKENQSAAYFLMPTRFWEMASGSLLFIGTKNNIKNNIFGKVPPFLISLLMIALMFYKNPLNGFNTFAIVCLTSLLIFSLKPEKIIYKFLTKRLIVYVGLISYSLYLWHWGILAISRWTVGVNIWTFPFQITLIFIISIISYKFIETPIRNNIWLNKKIKIYLLGFLIITSSFLSIFFIDKNNSKIFSGKIAKIEQKGAGSLKNNLPSTLSKSVWNGSDCWFNSSTDIETSKIIELCSFGNFYNAKKRIIVLGNSFAPALAAMFDKVAADGEFSFLLFTNQFNKDANFNPTGLNINSKYSDQFIEGENFKNLIKFLKNEDAVMWASDLNEFLDISTFYKGKKDLKKFGKGISSFRKKLNDKEIKLIMLDALPLAREAKCPPDLALNQWFNSFNSKLCTMPGRNETLQSKKRLHKFLKREFAGVYMIDLFDIFCPQDKCTYFNYSKNIILYRDEASHPSFEAALYSSQSFQDQLKKIFNY